MKIKRIWKQITLDTAPSRDLCFLLGSSAAAPTLHNGHTPTSLSWGCMTLPGSFPDDLGGSINTYHGFSGVLGTPEDLMKNCFLEDDLSWYMSTHIHVLHWWMSTHIHVLRWWRCTHIYVLHWCTCTHTYAHCNHLQRIRPLEKQTNSFVEQRPKCGVITC